jgi:putative solute:sodium symporter small subunit
MDHVNKSAEAESSPDPAVSVDSRHRAYWRANIRLVLILLTVWFVVGCVLSILLVDQLNRVSLGGFPLGFWFSQQGTIVVFIVLVYIYAARLQKLDRQHDVEDDGLSELPKDH